MKTLWADRDSAPELNEAICTWVCGLTGLPRFDDFTSMAVLIDRRWLSRPVIREINAYVFDQLGCQMIINRVSERDLGQARMLKAVGYVEHFIPRLRGRDEGELIYTLTDDAWRASPLSKVVA